MCLSDSQLKAVSVPELHVWLADPHYGRRAQAARWLTASRGRPV